MHKETIEGQLTTVWAARPLVYHPVTHGSTNDLAGTLARQGAVHGTLVVTGEQQSGRGRMGRAWLCPPGANIAMSLILRPEIPMERIPLLTLIAGLSVAEAIAALLPAVAPQVRIKWPNDIVIAGRKVCGILTESVTMPEGEPACCIIGIGINILQREFPGEIAATAGSVLSQTGITISRSATVAAFCGRFEKNYDEFAQTADLAPFLPAYETRLAGTGSTVRVIEPGEAYEGTALGIDRDGCLLVRKQDGETVRVIAGDVSVRGLCGYI
ncbi:MAG: biotin--[Lachnospiraceae bacterium]|nr:biotin--[acetyl-CoA-carboxylase] ligase [Lachnospiraceae bacterium]